MNGKYFLLFRLIAAFAGATAFCIVLLMYYPIAAVACIPMYILIAARAKELFVKRNQ